MRSPRNIGRLLGATLAASAAILGSRQASAQTVTVSTAAITRQVKLRTDGQTTLWVSRSDCLADDVFTVPVTLASFTGYSLEVWGGQNGIDCSSDITVRQGTTQQCLKLAEVSSIATTVPVLQIRAQDIAVIGDWNLDPTGVQRLFHGPGVGTADDCNAPLATDTPLPIAIYFLPVLGSAVANPVPLTGINLDLLGPQAPTNVGVGIGESLLKVTWSQTVSTDAVGYQFFCDPPPGQTDLAVLPPPTFSCPTTSTGILGGSGGTGGTDGSTTLDFNGGAGGDSGAGGDFGAGGDSGASGEAGSAGESSGGMSGGAGTSDAAGASSSNVCDVPESTCKSQQILQTAIPNGLLYCGSATGLLSTSGTITKLVNGVTVTIGVAGIDAVGNVGALGTPVCATPAPIDDFYKVYRADGGTAGGGYCSARTPFGGRSVWPSVLLLGVVGGVAALRRRRPR